MRRSLRAISTISHHQQPGSYLVGLVRVRVWVRVRIRVRVRVRARVRVRVRVTAALGETQHTSVVRAAAPRPEPPSAGERRRVSLDSRKGGRSARTLQG